MNDALSPAAQIILGLLALAVLISALLFPLHDKAEQAERHQDHQD